MQQQQAVVVAKAAVIAAGVVCALVVLKRALSPRQPTELKSASPVESLAAVQAVEESWESSPSAGSGEHVENVAEEMTAIEHKLSHVHDWAQAGTLELKALALHSRDAAVVIRALRALLAQSAFARLQTLMREHGVLAAACSCACGPAEPRYKRFGRHTDAVAVLAVEVAANFANKTDSHAILLDTGMVHAAVAMASAPLHSLMQQAAVVAAARFLLNFTVTDDGVRLLASKGLIPALFEAAVTAEPGSAGRAALLKVVKNVVVTLQQEESAELLQQCPLVPAMEATSERERHRAAKELAAAAQQADSGSSGAEAAQLWAIYTAAHHRACAGVLPLAAAAAQSSSRRNSASTTGSGSMGRSPRRTGRVLTVQDTSERFRDLRDAILK